MWVPDILRPASQVFPDGKIGAVPVACAGHFGGMGMDSTTAAAARRAHLERCRWLRDRILDARVRAILSEHISETELLMHDTEAAQGSSSTRA